MNEDADIQQGNDDGQAWARVYIATLSSPACNRGLSAAELAQYARAVADRWVDFLRACRRASKSAQHARDHQPDHARTPIPAHLGAWRGVDQCEDRGSRREEPR